MRSQIDEADAHSRSAETTATAVPGGKALKRLELFGDQRGFDVDAPIVDTEGPPAGAEEGVPFAEGGARATGRRRRTAQEGARTFAAEEIAALYIEGARALEAAEAEAPPALEAEAPAVTRAAVPPMWRLVGPSRIPNGQTYGSSRVDVSGRISAIAVDPTNGNHILCGAAAGGVWETRDGGTSWVPRTDTMPTLATGAIAFDPRSPNLVYAGMGEGDFYAGLGAGLLRSPDGGTTWTVYASAPFVGSGFHDLLVDPASSSHLLAATTMGGGRCRRLSII